MSVGLSQLPFYHQKFPASLKFGGIGVIIGEKILDWFGFLNEKIRYVGNENTWWNDQLSRIFQEHSKCLEEQYKDIVDVDFQKIPNVTLYSSIGYTL